MTIEQFENVRGALKAAPALVEHIVSITPMVTTLGSADDTIDAKRTEPPLPMNAGAFNDANEVYARLVYWATYWARVIHAQPPGPARRAWRNAATNVVGLPAGVEPAEARYAVSIMATWLGIQLEEIFRHKPDDIDYFATEIAEVHQAAARWPRDVEARYTELMCRIPACAGRVALWPFEKVTKWVEQGKHLFLPPEGAQVLCDSCSDQWSEVEYTGDIERRLLAAKEQRKTEKVQARLAKKYAIPSPFPLLLGTVAGKVRHTDHD